MNIKIILHNKVLYNKECQYLLFKNEDGEIGILKDHVPIVSLGKIGHLKIKQNNNILYVAYKNGIFKFYKNEATLLASVASINESQEDAYNDVEKILKDKKDISQKEQIDFSRLERDLMENIKKAQASKV